MIGAAETPAAEDGPPPAPPRPQMHAPPPERPVMRPGAPVSQAGAPIVEPKPDALPAPPDAPAPSAPTARAAATAVGVSAEAAAVWSKVVHVCVQQHPLLRAIVTNSMLVSLSGERALLSCAERFASSAPKWREKLGEVFTRERGVTTVVEFEQSGAPLAAPPAAPAESGSGEPAAPVAGDATAPGGAAPAAPALPARPTMPGPGAIEHPLVKQAIELFGARVVDVQPRRTS